MPLVQVSPESTAASEQPFLEQAREELLRTQREIQEISMLLVQSRVEVDKLTQRNASITSHLRQIQNNFDTVPRQDIRVAYEASQDAQQRLFTMRGQLEKLQSDQGNLERYAAFIQRVLELYEAEEGSTAPAKDDGKNERVLTAVRVVEAQEAERQRLSRQMHDGPAQALSNFILQAEIAMRLFDVDVDRARTELNSLKVSATSSFQRVREFIFELRPMQLDDLGLVPTVRRYSDEFQKKSGIQTQFQFTGSERRFENYREVILFRAIQELLARARDEAEATQIKMWLDLDEKIVRLTVEDNGKGINVDEALSSGPRGANLSSLRERVELLDGKFDVHSRPGQGTRVAIELPAGSPVPLN